MYLADEDQFGELAGERFTKQDVFRAFLMKSSQSSDDQRLFKDSVLAKLPKLKEWFDDPNGKQASFFRTMAVAEFRAWQNKALESGKGRGEGSSAHGKRYVEIDDEEDDGHKRAKKKGKGASHGKKHSGPSDPDSSDLDEGFRFNQ